MKCIFSVCKRCSQGMRFMYEGVECDGEKDKKKCPFWTNTS